MESGAGSRFVINVVGLVGLLFGALAIVRDLLDLSFFGFTTAPYDWLQLTGFVRYVPPLMVLVVCLAAASTLERRTQHD